MNGQIRYTDENKLSDYEDVTYPFTAQYDGFVTAIVSTGANQFGNIYINDNVVSVCGGISNAREYGCGNSVTIPLNKGDIVTVGGNASSITGKVRYYKLRDYSNR